MSGVASAGDIALTERDLEAAQACVHAGRVHEAETRIAKLLRESPANGRARSLAGLLAYMKGDYAVAEREILTAIAAEPLHFDAHYVLAFTLASLGRAEDATTAFRRVLALDPGCGIARLRLAELLIERGHRGEAIACLDEGRRMGMREDEIATVMGAAGADVLESSGEDAPPRLAAPEPRPEALLDTVPWCGGPERSGAASTGPEIAWVDPRAILHERRLDVAAKYLYARALLGLPALHSRYRAEDVYLRHIQYRTGGAEPMDEERKGDLASFTTQFARLVSSMRRDGFDPCFAIPVARRTGLLLNGAHRLAAALALGLDRVPVVYQDGVDGLTWDLDWFVTNGFTPLELDELTRAWIDCQGERAGTVILWSPAIAHWDAIESEIGERVAIAASREFALPAAAFGELVRDVYATDWGPVVGENIERKVAFLGGHAPRLRLLVVRASDASELAALKRVVRKNWAHVVPADRFATLHTTETVRETAHVANLLLSRENLAGLCARPAAGLRPEFLRWMRDYHAALARLKIDPEEVCVVGSAVLEALGVRDATDLDFTVSHAVRRRRFHPGVTHVTSEIDVVAQDYPRVLARAATPTDDDLLRDRAMHFRVRGLKFAALDVVLARKLHQRRPKDLADAERVGRARLAGRLPSELDS